MGKRQAFMQLVLMGLLVMMLQLVIFTVAAAQDGTAPVAGGFDPLSDPRFTAFFVAAALANRVVEFAKPGIRGTKYSENVQAAMLRFVAVAAGVLIAFTSNINLVTSYRAIPPLAGVIMTGAVIGGGSDLLNLFITLLYEVRDFLGTANTLRGVQISERLRQELGTQG